MSAGLLFFDWVKESLNVEILCGKPESWKNLDDLGLKIRNPELHEHCVFLFFVNYYF